MKIQFTAKETSGKAKGKQALVIAVNDSLKLGSLAAAFDKKAGGAIERAMKAGAFEGKKGQIESISGTALADRIFLIGLGKEENAVLLAQELGGHITAACNAAKIKQVEIHIDSIKGLKPAEAAANIAFGVALRNYAFLKYHTTRKKELSLSLETATFVLKDDKGAQKLWEELSQVIEGVNFARDVVTEPGNVIYPETLAKEAQRLAEVGVKVEVLGRAQMEKLGMGALLGVAQGSVREAKMIVLQWNGGKKSQKPVAFIGKGVTFDTGGISIKPAQNMEDMKYDMAGSAAVLGLMRTLAGRKAKVNAVGVIGAVENMPDGNAQRPGDVVTSMSGQTIEVINTDAEGRLVLSDALWYCQNRFKPQFMINLATLTGAIVITLGSSRCGVFSNDDDLAKKIAKSSEKSGEMSWRLPLGDEYDKQINSDIADMKNVGEGREAGSITAAQFLQRFVNNVPWAHLDIAGVAWSGKGKPNVPKGATGYGVRLLNQLVKDYYEE